MTEKRVLITGASGFVGRVLARTLLASGSAVLGVDIRPQEELCVAQGNYDHVLLDIRAREDFANLVSDFRPNGLVHLAARHMIPECEAAPDECIDVNVGGTESVLASFEIVAPDWFIYASSADVYRPQSVGCAVGDPLGSPFVYGRTKISGEALVARTAHQIPTLVARFFNVYGPGDENAHFIPTVMAQAVKGGTVRCGNLSSVRDYIYVDDVVRALESWSRAPVSVVRNFGSGTPRSGQEVIMELELLLRRPLEMEFDRARLRHSDRAKLFAATPSSRDTTDFRLGLAFMAIALMKGANR